MFGVTKPTTIIDAGGFAGHQRSLFASSIFSFSTGRGVAEGVGGHPEDNLLALGRPGLEVLRYVVSTKQYIVPLPLPIRAQTERLTDANT